MEAAPPQLVSVMRRRTSKMLDTINEDDRVDMAVSNNQSATQYSSSSAAAAAAVKGTIALPCSSSGSFAAGHFDRSMSIFQE